ncbi:hypothetical protein RMATCC62417_08685 [Rhizopus microsporus]|nr:hypothetical protein RMATCC62417_08685 [Rhizopus microsporus]
MHIHLNHQYILDSRTMAKQNKGTSVFNENNLLKHPNTPIAYACPSCINYYQSKDEFKSHVLDMHVMIISRGSSPDRENGWMIDGVDILEEHFRYRDECSRRYKNGTIVFTGMSAEMM